MKLKIIFAFFLIGIIVINSCSNDNTDNKKEEDIGKVREMEQEEMVERGRYLVLAGGCNDCHSPKIMTQQGPQFDTTRLLSGHPAGSQLPPINLNSLKPGNWISMSPDITAFVGPWGISYSANLTPDSATGVGAWGAEVFIKALRTGKHLGQENGRPILPPMPWPEIGKMKEEDLRSIYAYLTSLPPINNRVPAPVPPNEVK
jgi:hypothetical protein